MLGPTIWCSLQCLSSSFSQYLYMSLPCQFHHLHVIYYNKNDNNAKPSSYNTSKILDKNKFMFWLLKLVHFLKYWENWCLVYFEMSYTRVILAFGLNLFVACKTFVQNASMVFWLLWFGQTFSIAQVILTWRCRRFVWYCMISSSLMSNFAYLCFQI